MPSPIDIQDWAKVGSVSFQAHEPEDIRQVQIEKDRRDNRIDSYKGVVVFSVFVAAIVVIGSLCAYRVFFDMAAPEDSKRWAQQTLLSLISGAASFIAGRKIGSK